MSLRPSEPGATKADMNPSKRYIAITSGKTVINVICAYCQRCTAPACPLFDFRPYQNIKEQQGGIPAILGNK